MKRQRARAQRRIAEVNRKSAERKQRLRREAAARAIEVSARAPDRTDRFAGDREGRLAAVRGMWATPPAIAGLVEEASGEPDLTRRIVGEMQSFPRGPSDDRPEPQFGSPGFASVILGAGVITMPSSPNQTIAGSYATVRGDGAVMLLSPDVPQPIGPIGTVVRDNGDGTVQIRIDPTAMDGRSFAALASGQRVGLSIGRQAPATTAFEPEPAPEPSWPTSEDFMYRFGLWIHVITRRWIYGHWQARGVSFDRTPLGKTTDRIGGARLSNRHHAKRFIAFMGGIGNVVCDCLDEMGEDAGRVEARQFPAMRRRVVELLCEVMPLDIALELTSTDAEEWALRRDVIHAERGRQMASRLEKDEILRMMRAEIDELRATSSPT